MTPGPLVLPTSALQGLPLAAAARALLRLRPDRLQLCPGNPPSPGLQAILGGAGSLLHHGFSWDARRVEVWRPDGEPLVPLAGRTVHPPAPAGRFEDWLEAHPGVALEVMPPGAWLGDEATLTAAMDRGVPLAVDVSHVHMQAQAGTLGPAVQARLWDYPHVVEVHLSENDGRRDLHLAPGPRTFGADWARQRRAAGVPLVLEWRMHHQTADERQRQVEAWR